MSVYQNQIKSMGPSVDAFGGEMIILFGENAPDTLKDYCYGIDVIPTNERIREGMNIAFDGESFIIQAVGNMAERNLVSLGHLTINFTGNSSDCLPGAIVVENKPAPNLSVGTRIEILA